MEKKKPIWPEEDFDILVEMFTSPSLGQDADDETLDQTYLPLRNSKEGDSSDDDDDDTYDEHDVIATRRPKYSHCENIQMLPGLIPQPAPETVSFFSSFFFFSFSSFFLSFPHLQQKSQKQNKKKHKTKRHLITLFNVGPHCEKQLCSPWPRKEEL